MTHNNIRLFFCICGTAVKSNVVFIMASVCVWIQSFTDFGKLAGIAIGWFCIDTLMGTNITRVNATDLIW